LRWGWGAGQITRLGRVGVGELALRGDLTHAELAQRGIHLPA
jgi:hypothetical protein